MFEQDDKVFISEDDDCDNCMNARTGECILLQLFHFGFISITQDFVIDNCPFYEKSGKLKRIK